MRIRTRPSTDRTRAGDSAQHGWIKAYSRAAGPDVHEALPDPGQTAGRPDADALAARQKWHKGLCAAWFNPEQTVWYDALEQARVECLTARELPGAALNLRAVSARRADIQASALALYGSARTLWGLEFEDTTGLGPDPKSDSWERIIRFIKVAKQRLMDDPALLLEAPETRQALYEAARVLEDEKAFARTVAPLVARFSEASCKGGPAQSHEEREINAEPQTAPKTRPLVGHGEESLPESHSEVGDYSIFRTSWDECGPARSWLMPGDNEALRKLNKLDRRVMRKLAHRLQRRLLAKTLRHWDFEQEEGMLDSRRLAALAGDHPEHRIFKIEREAQVAEACVTFLVDQSGSMRGPGHFLAAQALDLAVHTLEICGIAVEVLGFTTRFGSENPVLQTWKNAGSAGGPGRLNALRHIILKDTSEPWRAARRNLGLLLRPGFGKENLDGESVLWAAKRLLARPQQNRILIVLSDGSPYDEATVRHNDSNILSDHLIAVVAALSDAPLLLTGIGTGRDVGRYYPRSATVRRDETIGDVLFSSLGEAFDT